ncbi:hypothetical protein SteCoe_10858 [Stentor coeruleus]|uniref:B box-type domain-containing protein n=1 Tax=Stentor coeruleus TaxID=5963 RepID=A0A1R2CER2_9CILI|nr:hypothetical protein SteCoe_10858 [Stentor coeruleus]
MDEKLCESCKKTSEIACFCQRLFFCSECIGKHLLLPSSTGHTPVLLDEDLIKLIDLSLTKLRKSEYEILEKAAKVELAKKTILKRIDLEVKSIDEYYTNCANSIKKIIKEIQENLNAIEINIIEKVKNNCEEMKKKLSHWIKAVESSNLEFNSVIKALSLCENLEEMEKVEILSKSLKVEDFQIEKFIIPKIHFSLDFKERSESESLSKFDDKDDTIEYSQSPTLACLLPYRQANSFSSEENEPDSFMPLRFSMNLREGLKSPESFEKSSFISESPPEKRRLLYSKTHISTKLSRPSNKTPPQALVWIDNVSECIQNYSLCNSEVETTYLSNKDQNLDGSVWCFTNEGSLILTGGIAPSARKQTLIIDHLSGYTFVAVSMYIGRYHHAAVCVGSFLYVMGGANGTALKECEKYNILTNSWTKVGNLNVAREFLAACVHRGRIYVAGGENADSIETYNTVSNRFSLLRVRLPSICRAFMVSVDDEILIFHKKKLIGFDSAKTSCVEYCDLPEDHWWTPANHIVSSKSVYFIKKGTVFRMDLGEMQLHSLVTFS